LCFKMLSLRIFDEHHVNFLVSVKHSKARRTAGLSWRDTTCVQPNTDRYATSSFETAGLYPLLNGGY